MKSRLWTVLAMFGSGVSVVGTSFLLYATGQKFLVTSVSLVVLDYLPAQFISVVTQQFGDNALWMSMVFSGFVLSLVLGAVLLITYRVSTHFASRYEPILGFCAATVTAFVVSLAAVGTPTAVLAPALVGGLVVVFFEVSTDSSTGFDADRRTVVRTVGTVTAFNVLAHLIGFLRREQTQDSEQQLQQEAETQTVDSMLEDARSLGLDAEGIKPLVPKTNQFYRVDINPTPIQVDTSDWELSITGLVEQETTVSYEELRNEERIDQFKTIRCLGDDISGDQMDTALWTGCSVGDLLADANPQGEYAMLHAEDEYFYSIPVELLERCILAYGMNGFELPSTHGYPVRLLVPNHWGKLHVKWLTEIEIIDEFGGGWWEQRGWEGLGEVNTVTKVDRINRFDDGTIQVVGHAYAGTRGVDAVEVSVDGGDSWEQATLSESLPDRDTYRQWLYEIEPDGRDRYKFLARTVDGEGTAQPQERSDPYPDGATGWIERTLRT